VVNSPEVIVEKADSPNMSPIRKSLLPKLMSPVTISKDKSRPSSPAPDTALLIPPILENTKTSPKQQPDPD
jgi:hypothetical protein